VAGALAQHAEATLERIGTHRTPLVRELFRNLVTAQGTRAARERDELLSVFNAEGRSDVPAEAEDVLGALVDARLLTSFEKPGDEAGESHHEIEIVHESLLSRWPRLVRWQTQDADGAQLRDQLRQAAQAWQDRGRPEDLLWSGTAYRDFAVWKERYSGGLSATEEAFASAAERRAGRRRRRRRWALAAAVTVTAVVAATTSVLWRQADAEARRAEAAELLALGRLELEDHPTGGLAYALASLELTDTPAARRFALETLAHSGAAFVLPGESQSVDFSRDGRWLATGGLYGPQLWSREGGPFVSLGDSVGAAVVEFDPQGPLLSVRDTETEWVLSIPDGRELHRLDAEGVGVDLRQSRLFTFRRDARGRMVSSLPVGEGEARVVGRWDDRDVSDWPVRVPWEDSYISNWVLSPDQQWLAYARGPKLFVLPFEDVEAAPRLLGEHPAAVVWVSFGPDSDRLVSSDASGEIRIWSIDGGVPSLERTLRSGLEGARVEIDRTGSTLVAGEIGGIAATSRVALVWDLNGPPDAEPHTLLKADVDGFHDLSLEGRGHWLATANNSMTVLWPLGRRTRILRGQEPPFIQVAFTPDGSWLASYSAEGSAEGRLRLWPLSPAVAPGRRVLIREGTLLPFMAIDPDGRNILVVSAAPGRALLVPLDGGPPLTLQRFSSAWLNLPAISRDGRFGAAGSRMRPEGNLIELWDLQSGEVRTLDPRSNGEECGQQPILRSAVFDVEFTSDGRLLSAGRSGLRLWELGDGTNTLLRPCMGGPDTLPFLGGSREDRYLLLERDHVQRTSLLSFHDLRARESWELTSHGNAVWSVALDPSGQIAVTGGYDGLVRVGGVSDEEPHLLYGHDLEVTSVAVSPDGQWIASASQDGTIRLWPMPEGRPFHTLPYDEILGRLRSFTNLRVVRDEDATTGYSVEPGPFPGWAAVPEW
jgi:WD40 repeat protein